MTTHYETSAPCPQCGDMLDSAQVQFQLRGLASPTPGDLTLCWNCGAWLVFDEPPAVHVMTDIELAGLDEDEYEALRLVKQQWERFKARGQVFENVPEVDP